MSTELIKELIDSGIHFGHRVSRWNPKMKPYIFGKRNLIHIINVKETYKGILLARRFLARVVSQGKDILLVGTKRQARKAIEQNAQRVGMHWVNDRWLGGTLTNFREIRKRVGRLDELERLNADGMLDAYSKKQGSTLRREMRKIQRNLGGLRNMTQLPGALVIIDQKREIIAVKEAHKMGIPVVCLLDTDSDPDVVDIPSPGNDDAMRAIEIIVMELCDAVAEGVHARAEAGEDQGEEAGQQGRRRSRRMTTSQRYEESTDADSGREEPAEAQPESGQLPASGGAAQA